LLCGVTWQRSHNNVSDGNDVVAVRVAKVARQRLCRAPKALPCSQTLSCVGAFAVRAVFAVRLASAAQLTLSCDVVFAEKGGSCDNGPIPTP
jgi:hypothetical protein